MTSMKRKNQKNGNSEKETTEQKTGLEGHIRKRTILNRKHLKQDDSGNDKSEKEKYQTEIRKRTMLNSTNLKKVNSEKDR